MELWYTENQTENVRLSLRVKETLYKGKSEYQTIDIIDTYDYGRMLVLDGLVMTTEKDEFVYHETIAHVAMLAHKNPQNVLIIGGGDGGTLREVVKHKTLQKATMVEIDAEVMEASRKFFPFLHGGWDHPRAEVLAQDGFLFLKNNKVKYDVIMIDGTDPIGPGEILFTEDFYSLVLEHLAPDGIFVQQTESIWVHPHIIADVNKRLRKKFSSVSFFDVPIPTYPSGYWNFSCCTNLPGFQPVSSFDMKRLQELGELRFLNEEILRGIFALPNFAKKFLEI